MIRFTPTEHAGQSSVRVGPFYLMVSSGGRPAMSVDSDLARLMRQYGHAIDDLGFVDLPSCTTREEAETTLLNTASMLALDLSRILADAAKDRPRGPDYSTMSMIQAGYALAATEMT